MVQYEARSSMREWYNEECARAITESNRACWKYLDHPRKAKQKELETGWTNREGRTESYIHKYLILHQIFLHNTAWKVLNAFLVLSLPTKKIIYALRSPHWQCVHICVSTSVWTFKPPDWFSCNLLWTSCHQKTHHHTNFLFINCGMVDAPN